MYKSFKIFVLLGLVSAILFTSCDKNPSTGSDVNMRFKAKVGTSPMVLYDDYLFGTLPIRFTKLRFFVSDIRFLKSDGTSVKVLDVANIDCYDHHSLAATAADGEPLLITGVPEGDYTSVTFGVGVTPSLNAKTPSNFGTDSPLHNSSNYWEAWGSYIHTMFEGKIDTLGGQPFDLGFLFHVGQDALFREVTLTKNFSVVEGQVADFPVQIDLLAFFTNQDGTTIDVLHENFTHSPTPNTPTNIIEFNLAKKIADNMSGAFSAE